MTKRQLVVAAVATLLITTGLRLPSLLLRPLAGFSHNQDASMHVLATMRAYASTPLREHFLLPIFTLGDAHDHWIDNLPGASRFDDEGNLFYTSWPPGLFVLPHALSVITRLEPTPIFIRTLSLLLQVAAALLLGLVCGELAKRLEASDDTRRLAIAIAFVAYMTSPEGLRSGLWSYWAQQLYEPIFLAQLLLFVRGRRRVAFLALAWVGCLVDWTAFIANTGFILWELRRAYVEKDRAALRTAEGVIAMNLLAIAMLLAWFNLKIPLVDLISNQQRRAGVRSGRWQDYAKLAAGYVGSLGLFVALIWPVSGAIRAWRAVSSDRRAVVLRVLAAPLFLLAFALLENVALPDHATRYTYDRLKMVALVATAASVAVCVAPALARRTWRLTIVAAIASLGWWGYVAFVADLSVDERITEPFRRVVRQYTPDDALAFSSKAVRGTEVYSTGRNLYELADLHAKEAGLPVETWAEGVVRERGFRTGVLFSVAGDSSTVRITRVDVGQPPTEVGVERLLP